MGEAVIDRTLPIALSSRQAGTAFTLIGQTLLGFSLLAPFGISFYGVDKRIEFVCLLALMGLSLQGFCAERTSRTTRYLFGWIAVAVVLGATVWSLVFTIHTTGSFLDSFLSMRWQAYWLLFPALLALHENGVGRYRLMLTVAFSLALVLALLFYRQLTWDLAAMVRSEPEMARFIRSADSWRGFRLADPQYALTVMLMMVLSIAVAVGRLRLPAVLALAAIAPLYVQIFSRLSILFALLTLPVAVLLTWRGKPHLRWAGFLLLGVAVLAAAAFAEPLLQYVQADRSGSLRLRTLDILWQQFAEHPLLGYGADSAQGVRYEQLFGAHFFPSDLGYAGIAFAYGLVGLCIALSLCFQLVRSARRRQGTLGGPLDRTLAFATIWSLVYLTVAGLTLQPLTAPDGIVTFAFLAAMNHLLRPPVPGRTA